jgi:hypothetical protein
MMSGDDFVEAAKSRFGDVLSSLGFKLSEVVASGNLNNRELIYVREDRHVSIGCDRRIGGSACSVDDCWRRRSSFQADFACSLDL